MYIYRQRETRGVESVLVTYPEEGHGVRKMPASMDHAARVVGWFEERTVLVLEPNTMFE